MIRMLIHMYDLAKFCSLTIIGPPNPGPVLTWPMQDGLLPLLIFYRRGGLVFGKPDVLQRNRTMTASTRIVRSRRTTSVWLARLVLGPLLPFVFYRRGQLETLSPHPTMEILDIITI